MILKQLVLLSSLVATVAHARSPRVSQSDLETKRDRAETVVDAVQVAAESLRDCTTRVNQLTGNPILDFQDLERRNQASVDTVLRYIRICMNSSTVLGQLDERLKRKGIPHRSDVIAKIVRQPEAAESNLKEVLPKLTAREVREVLRAVAQTDELVSYSRGFSPAREARLESQMTR